MSPEQRTELASLLATAAVHIRAPQEAGLTDDQAQELAAHLAFVALCIVPKPDELDALDAAPAAPAGVSLH